MLNLYELLLKEREDFDISHLEKLKKNKKNNLKEGWSKLNYCERDEKIITPMALRM